MKSSTLMGLMMLGVLSCAPPKKKLDSLAGERAGVYCAQETFDLMRPGLKSTNPTQQNERFYESVEKCWNLTVAVDTEQQKSVADFTRIDEGADGGLLLGCAFHGVGNTVRADLQGGCVTPTDAGYYRLALTQPTQYLVTAENTSLEFDLSWQEVRGKDLIVGTGRIFLSVPQTPIKLQAEYDPRIPTDPVSGCHMPTCSTVAFAGHGTLVTGNPLVCNELLASYATPFSVFFDAQDRMSFAADTPEAMRFLPVFGKTTCTVDTWSGSRPSPYRRFHFDPGQKVMSFDETQLHQTNNLSDVCTLHWETSITGC